VIYRRANIQDSEVLTRLLCELYENVEHEQLLAENIILMDDFKQAFFLAFNDNEPVGVCHVALRGEYVNGKEYDGACGYLEAVYVRSPHRKLGVATKLVELCEAWARDNSCHEFLSDCLLDNMDSFKFHLELGFIETERCIFFRKEL